MGIGLGCGLVLAAFWGSATNSVHKDWVRVDKVCGRCRRLTSLAAAAAAHVPGSIAARLSHALLLATQEYEVKRIKNKRAFDEWLAKQPYDDEVA